MQGVLVVWEGRGGVVTFLVTFQVRRTEYGHAGFERLRGVMF